MTHVNLNVDIDFDAATDPRGLVSAIRILLGDALGTRADIDGWRITGYATTSVDDTATPTTSAQRSV